MSLVVGEGLRPSPACAGRGAMSRLHQRTPWAPETATGETGQARPRRAVTRGPLCRESRQRVGRLCRLGPRETGGPGDKRSVSWQDKSGQGRRRKRTVEGRLPERGGRATGRGEEAKARARALSEAWRGSAGGCGGREGRELLGGAGRGGMAAARARSRRRNTAPGGGEEATWADRGGEELGGKRGRARVVVVVVVVVPTLVGRRRTGSGSEGAGGGMETAARPMAMETQRRWGGRRTAGRRAGGWMETGVRAGHGKGRGASGGRLPAGEASQTQAGRVQCHVAAVRARGVPGPTQHRSSVAAEAHGHCAAPRLRRTCGERWAPPVTCGTGPVCGMRLCAAPQRMCGGMHACMHRPACCLLRVRVRVRVHVDGLHHAPCTLHMHYPGAMAHDT